MQPAGELTLMEILQLVDMEVEVVEDADLSEEQTTKEEMEKTAVVSYTINKILLKGSKRSLFLLLN